MPNTLTPDRSTHSRVHPGLAFAGFFGLTFVAAALGAIASVDAREFYGGLTKPAWAPPAALFGPVWTVLYALMAVAAWLVWRERGWARGRGALGLFVVQLAFNAAWSWLFFALHRGGWAFACIVVLLVLIAATLAAFARIQRVAAALLVPYLLWVAFATALNWSVWRSNPLLS